MTMKKIVPRSGDGLSSVEHSLEKMYEKNTELLEGIEQICKTGERMYMYVV